MTDKANLRLRNCDKLGPVEASFATITGDRILSRQADVSVVYRSRVEHGDLAFLLLGIDGVGLHVGMDRQLCRQIRDALDDALGSFPVPRHGV